MKSKDIKYVLNIAMRLTVIVAVVVAMLATVNAVTKDRIAENNAASRNAACGELIEGAEFESFDISALNVDYSDITNFDKNSVAVWRGTKNGELAGWCVEVTGKGYSSDGIGLIAGISSDGQTVLGVRCVSSSETSGIGSKVVSADYLSKFADRTSSEVASVDAVSGATRTSRGVKDGIKAAVACVKAITEQEGGR